MGGTRRNNIAMKKDKCLFLSAFSNFYWRRSPLTPGAEGGLCILLGGGVPLRL